MTIERQYIRQFLNESKKPSRKFEDSGYKYAYNTKSHVEDGGYEVRDSVEELETKWDDFYGDFNPNNALIMKPATSVDKAMVWIASIDGDFIYPSINAAINGSMGLYAQGFEEGDAITDITEEEIRELLQTKDLERAEELLGETFVDVQDYGYFEGLYEYVSGPMPKEDGVTPGKALVKNKKQKASAKNLEYYKRKILDDPGNLRKIPDKVKTPELCMLAAGRDGSVLRYVPDELKTPELCMIAVKKWGYALKFVPDELKTPEICKIAVEKDIYALALVPDELKTPELCKLAVEKWSSSLQYVPDELIKISEICKIAVEEYGPTLKFVPDKLKTLELCKIAVKNTDKALEYVPDHLKEQVKKELGIK